VEKPIKEGILQHDPTTEGSGDGSISKLTTKAGSGDIIPKRVTLVEPNMTLEQRGISPKLMQPPSRLVKATDDSYWEADLGGSDSTDFIELDMEFSEMGKKRKYTDDVSPVKNPVYKLGPRNTWPGKIKQTVIQGLVKKAKELKPILEVSISKGKVSEGELGIVTRDRSKKFAQESVHSTWLKKHKIT
jgi:hypothetical protein